MQNASSLKSDGAAVLTVQHEKERVLMSEHHLLVPFFLCIIISACVLWIVFAFYLNCLHRSDCGNDCKGY